MASHKSKMDNAVEVIPMPTAIKDEPVDIIDLDDEKSPEEIVNEWHEKIRKKINQHINCKEEANFIQMLEWYLNELKVATKDIEDLTNLENVMLRQIKIIEMSYKRLKTYHTTNDMNYLQIMEEVLTYYCDSVMKNITKKKKEVNKHVYKKCKAQICRRFKCLLVSSLLENQQSVLHVLINMRLEPEEATYKEIVNHCYSYFLTREKQERSEENYCRCYIMIERWKTVRKQVEHELLDKCLYTMFGIESEEEIRQFSESTEKILKASVNNTRGMIRNYFNYIRTSEICRDMDEIMLIDSNLSHVGSIASAEEWEATLLDDSSSSSTTFDSWRIEFEKASLASENDVPVKQEADADDDCMFVSSSLGDVNLSKSVLVRELCDDEHIAEIWYHVKEDTGQPTRNHSDAQIPRAKTRNTEKLINFNSRIDNSQPENTLNNTTSHSNVPSKNSSGNNSSQNLENSNEISPATMVKPTSQTEPVDTNSNVSSKNSSGNNRSQNLENSNKISPATMVKPTSQTEPMDTNSNVSSKNFSGKNSSQNLESSNEFNPVTTVKPISQTEVIDTNSNVSPKNFSGNNSSQNLENSNEISPATMVKPTSQTEPMDTNSNVSSKNSSGNNRSQNLENSNEINPVTTVKPTSQTEPVDTNSNVSSKNSSGNNRSQNLENSNKISPATMVKPTSQTEPMDTNSNVSSKNFSGKNSSQNLESSNEFNPVTTVNPTSQTEPMDTSENTETSCTNSTGSSHQILIEKSSQSSIIAKKQNEPRLASAAQKIIDIPNNLEEVDKINLEISKNLDPLPNSSGTNVEKVLENTALNSESTTENVPLKDVAVDKELSQKESSFNREEISNSAAILVVPANSLSKNNNVSNTNSQEISDVVCPARTKKEKVISEVQKITDLPDDPLVLVIDKNQGTELVRLLERELKKNNKAKSEDSNLEKEKLNSVKNGINENDNVDVVVVPQNAFASILTPPMDQNEDNGRDGTIEGRDQDTNNTKEITASHYYSSFALSQEDIDMDNQPAYQYATISREQPNVTFEQVVVSEVVSNQIIEAEVTDCKVIFGEANYIATTTEGFISDIGTYNIVMPDASENPEMIQSENSNDILENTETAASKLENNKDTSENVESAMSEESSNPNVETQDSGFRSTSQSKEVTDATVDRSMDVSPTDSMLSEPLLKGFNLTEEENSNVLQIKTVAADSNTTTQDSVAEMAADTCQKSESGFEEKKITKITFTATERVKRTDIVSGWSDVTDTQDLENIFSGPVNTQLKQNTIENPDENFDLFESDENLTAISKPIEKVQTTSTKHSTNSKEDKAVSQNKLTAENKELTSDASIQKKCKKVEKNSDNNLSSVNDSPNKNSIILKNISKPNEKELIPYIELQKIPILTAPPIPFNIDAQEPMDTLQENISTTKQSVEEPPIPAVLPSENNHVPSTDDVGSQPSVVKPVMPPGGTDGDSDNGGTRPNSPEIESPAFEPLTKEHILGFSTTRKSIYRAEPISGSRGLQTKIKKVVFNDDMNQEYIIPARVKNGSHKKKSSKLVSVVIDGAEVNINARSLLTHGVSPDDPRLLSGVNGWKFEEREKKKVRLTQKEVDRWLNLTKLVQRKKVDKLVVQNRDYCLLKNDREYLNFTKPSQVQNHNNPVTVADKQCQQMPLANGHHPSLDLDASNKVKKDSLLLDDPGSKYLRVALTDHSSELHVRKKRSHEVEFNGHATKKVAFGFDSKPNGASRLTSTTNFKPDKPKLKTYQRKGILKKDATFKDKKIGFENDSDVSHKNVEFINFDAEIFGAGKGQDVAKRKVDKIAKKDPIKLDNLEDNKLGRKIDKNDPAKVDNLEENKLGRKVDKNDPVKIDNVANNNVGLRSRSLRTRKRPNKDYEDVSKGMMYVKLTKAKI